MLLVDALSDLCQENESLNINFYIGTAVILVSIFLSPVLDALSPPSASVAETIPEEKR